LRAWSRRFRFASANLRSCKGARRPIRSWKKPGKKHASEFRSERNDHNLVMCNVNKLHSQGIVSSSCMVQLQGTLVAPLYGRCWQLRGLRRKCIFHNCAGSLDKRIDERDRLMSSSHSIERNPNFDYLALTLALSAALSRIMCGHKICTIS
jgi:hypothetical protein